MTIKVIRHHIDDNRATEPRPAYNAHQRLNQHPQGTIGLLQNCVVRRLKVLFTLRCRRFRRIREVSDTSSPKLRSYPYSNERQTLFHVTSWAETIDDGIIEDAFSL